MRNYRYLNINEAGRFSYERGLLKNVNPNLIANFNKVAEWIKRECPNLNGKFDMPHNPYYWVSLVVENGKAYLEEGSHGYSFSIALSTDETATMATGSCQSVPYAFHAQFFKNGRLEEFLKNWTAIKARIINENKVQSYVFSEDFEA